jgi:hypothetical protein
MTIKENKKRFKAKRTFVQKLFGYCPKCRKWFQFGVACRRLPLCYHAPTPEERYRTSCKKCYTKESDFWVQKWQAFWSVMAEDLDRD